MNDDDERIYAYFLNGGRRRDRIVEYYLYVFIILIKKYGLINYFVTSIQELIWKNKVQNKFIFFCNFQNIFEFSLCARKKWGKYTLSLLRWFCGGFYVVLFLYNLLYN